MKLHRGIVSLVCSLALLLQSVPAYSQFSATYKYYIDLAKDSFATNDFQSFLFYLEAAHSADPSAEEPFELLKNIRVYQSSKQLLRGYLLQAIQALEREAYKTALFYFQLSLLVTPDDGLIKEYIDYVNKLISGEVKDRKPLVERIKKEYKIEIAVQAQVDTAKLKEETPPEPEPAPQEVEKKMVVIEEVEEEKDEELAEPPPEVEERIIEVARPERDVVAEEEPAKRIFVNEEDVIAVIPLDEELWAKQPGTVIEIEFNKSVILEGQNIERYLVLNENYVEVARLDRDRIQITSLRRGDTLFHLWDARGRWTFSIVGVLPLVAEEGLRRSEEELWEEYVDPFRLAYSNNWSSYYVGESPDNLHRRSLTFTQFIGIYGGTPYGRFDASANFFKFAESTENTGRAIGLTDGKIGPFKDFTLRGYDTFSYFSDLSLPGRYFRGGLIDAYAFDHRMKYTYLRGHDRANYLLSEGVTEIRKSYIEGASVTFNPDTDHQYSLNWARGWGIERPPHLRDRVFSADTEHQYGDWNVRGELAYDEESFASLVRTAYERENYSWRVNIRDIDEDFVTVTSRPPNQGEVGGNVLYDWEGEYGHRFSAGADLYRDRGIPNPDNPNAINYDLSAFGVIPLSETLQWSNGIYYLNTPQVISPQQNLHANTSLSKTFEILERRLTAHLTGLYQRSRFDLTPQSEYDRYTINAGFRYPIFRSLSYYLSYERSWVDVVQTGERNQPSVLSTGLSFIKTFKDLFTTEASISWRDEEGTEGDFTFLSGTDIVQMDLGFSYHPSADFEIFIDGSLRNITGESSDQGDFYDADVRFGLRTAWDTFFRWNPKGTVQGYVFKDLNKDGIREAGEPGIEGIKVRVGDYLVKTLERGYYGRDVRAESVKVALDLDSIPSGYSLTSDESKKVVIENGRTVDVDFGLSIHTEIYGVVYVDEDDNGSYDSGEKVVPGVRIVLDGDKPMRSDFEGIYTFYDIAPGTHSVAVDVNTVPMEYLPKIKLKHEIVVLEGSSYDLDVPLRRK